MGATPLPDNLVLKVVLAENPIEHHLDVMAGVPVAVIVEAARLLQHPSQFHAARAHELNVGLGGLVAVFEGALFFGLAPEHLVIAVGVERRIDVDQVNRGVRQFL